MDDIGFGNNLGILILIISGALSLIVPFSLGFSIVYFTLSSLMSNKNLVFYIKSKTSRLIILCLISAIAGYISMITLSPIFSKLASAIINVK